MSNIHTRICITYIHTHNTCIYVYVYIYMYICIHTGKPRWDVGGHQNQKTIKNKHNISMSAWCINRTHHGAGGLIIWLIHHTISTHHWGGGFGRIKPLPQLMRHIWRYNTIVHIHDRSFLNMMNSMYYNMFAVAQDWFLCVCVCVHRNVRLQDTISKGKRIIMLAWGVRQLLNCPDQRLDSGFRV
jgi:hypothetical protein